jgi:RNA-directed DNA polymerase
MSFPFDEYIAEARAGGHSEDFINETVDYAKRLDNSGLPVIFTPQHFAVLVGMPSSMIKTIIQFRRNQYIQFSIKKRNSDGLRHIMTPEKKLLYLQKWINKNILQKVQLLDCCTAYVPGTSLATNGYIHRNSKEILKLDLLKFFDTINEKRVYGFFKYLGYEPSVAYHFAQLTTAFPSREFWHAMSLQEIQAVGAKISFEDAVVPQGAATSPQLANCVANSLDKRLSKLAKKLNCRYSRYADDLVFSVALQVPGTLPSITLVKSIVESEGFFVNDKKTSYYKRGMKQYVTGLTVTHGFHVPKKTRQELYKHLYYARKYGPFEHLRKWAQDNHTKREFPYGFKHWLLGKISFVYSIDSKVGRKMLAQFNKIEWGFEETYSRESSQ